MSCCLARLCRQGKKPPCVTVNVPPAPTGSSCLQLEGYCDKGRCNCERLLCTAPALARLSSRSRPLYCGQCHERRLLGPVLEPIPRPRRCQQWSVALRIANADRWVGSEQCMSHLDSEHCSTPFCTAPICTGVSPCRTGVGPRRLSWSQLARFCSDDVNSNNNTAVVSGVDGDAAFSPLAASPCRLCHAVSAIIAPRPTRSQDTFSARDRGTAPPAISSGHVASQSNISCQCLQRPGLWDAQRLVVDGNGLASWSAVGSRAVNATPGLHCGVVDRCHRGSMCTRPPVTSALYCMCTHSVRKVRGGCRRVLDAKLQ